MPSTSAGRESLWQDSRLALDPRPASGYHCAVLSHLPSGWIRAAQGLCAWATALLFVATLGISQGPHNRTCKTEHHRHASSACDTAHGAGNGAKPGADNTSAELQSPHHQDAGPLCLACACNDTPLAHAFVVTADVSRPAINERLAAKVPAAGVSSGSQAPYLSRAPPLRHI